MDIQEKTKTNARRVSHLYKFAAHSASDKEEKRNTDKPSNSLYSSFCKKSLKQYEIKEI